MTREEALRRVHGWAWVSDERGSTGVRPDADEILGALSRPCIELEEGEDVVLIRESSMGRRIMTRRKA